jgi:stage II sporulation protein P
MEVLRLISGGCVISVVVLAVFFVFGSRGADALSRFFLYETMPLYGAAFTGADSKDVSAINNYYIPHEVFSPDIINTLMIDDSPATDGIGDIIGRDSVLFYQPTTEGLIGDFTHSERVLAPFFDGWLDDLDFLRDNFYTVATCRNTGRRMTEMTEDDFSARRFLEEDFRIEPSASEPRVLIFHTHMYEGYADSNPDNIFDGVFGVGERVADALYEKYGIRTLHFGGRFDLVNGEVSIGGAYERMDPVIQRILREYPSIEVVIDLHRDGVPDNMRLVTEIDGKPTARIMFVNGLSKTLQGARLMPIASLPNPNLNGNLAFSFQAQIAANELYPGLARKIYLNAYRYSLHMKPRSLLLEVGAQNNTMEEAFNAAEPIADVLARVLLGVE